MDSKIPIVKVLPQVPDDLDPLRWFSILAMCIVCLGILITFVMVVGF